jgi:protein-S-isoprenylcysteine O-methyltransferase Ste14
MDAWPWSSAAALGTEHYLTERFPDAYPVYKRSTKMLVPLIL